MRQVDHVLTRLSRPVNRTFRVDPEWPGGARAGGRDAQKGDPRDGHDDAGARDRGERVAGCRRGAGGAGGVASREGVG